VKSSATLRRLAKNARRVARARWFVAGGAWLEWITSDSEATWSSRPCGEFPLVSARHGRRDFSPAL
jgi:hypothetical protein